MNIDDTPFDVPPADHMVVITNDDRPGVIGTVGTLLGNAGVNIADMDVSRVDGSGTAAMLIAPTAHVSDEILDGAPGRPRHPQRHQPHRLSKPRKWSRCRAERDICSISRWICVRQVCSRRDAAVLWASARAASAKSAPSLA